MNFESISSKQNGSCQRIRFSSLVAAIKLQKPECSPLRKEQQRVVMMGSAKVGKSSIISQFLFDTFQDGYRETIEELYRAEYDDGRLILDILDTSGAHEFPAMRALAIANSDAFILVYSIDNEESWKEIERLKDQIVAARGSRVPIVVVGNKVDLPIEQRKIQHELAETIVAIDWECGYVECSAKTNTGMLDIFKELLVQSKIRYNLSPAVRRRRLSLPSYTRKNSKLNNSSKYSLKRHSCTVA